MRLVIGPVRLVRGPVRLVRGMRCLSTANHRPQPTPEGISAWATAEAASTRHTCRAGSGSLAPVVSIAWHPMHLHAHDKLSVPHDSALPVHRWSCYCEVAQLDVVLRMEMIQIQRPHAARCCMASTSIPVHNILILFTAHAYTSATQTLNRENVPRSDGLPDFRGPPACLASFLCTGGSILPLIAPLSNAT